MNNSPFSNQKLWIKETNNSFAWQDQYPVSIGHTLVIPKKYVSSVFELSQEEITDLMQLVCIVKNDLTIKYQPAGFNIGINDGVAAGQTVMHAHIHVIPRYEGDHIDPRGGIRAVIPKKKLY